MASRLNCGAKVLLFFLITSDNGIFFEQSVTFLLLWAVSRYFSRGCIPVCAYVHTDRLLFLWFHMYADMGFLSKFLF